MNRKTVKAAVEEARHFLQRASAYEARLDREDVSYEFCGTAESAALRRASMELTRALAKMRRPAE